MFRPAFGCAQHPKAGQNTQQVLFNLKLGNLLVNKTDLQALVEPTVTRLIPDPLAVLRLENQLYVARHRRSRLRKSCRSCHLDASLWNP